MAAPAIKKTLFLRTMSGQTFPVEASDENMKISQIKKIAKKDLGDCKLKIVFNGKKLSSKTTIKDIPDGSHLHIIIQKASRFSSLFCCAK